jgi:LmbE family N-acetylglucosaminyl deacetylase
MSLGEQGGVSGNTRRKEAQQSAKLLGVKSLCFAGFKDTRIEQGIRSIQRIEDVVRRLRPSRIYVPFSRDTHQDHRNTALASVSATRTVNQILAYESAVAVSDFAPSYYVSVDSTIELNRKALACFRSQRHKDYMNPSVIEARDRFRGLQARSTYAEAFEIVRFIDS